MGIISRKKRSEPSDRSENAELDIFMNDRSIHMTAFLMKVVGLWMARDDREQRKRDLTFTYSVAIILFGGYVEAADFYYSWPNVSDCVYIACNVLCLSMGLLKLFVVFVNRKKFIALHTYARKHYWHSDYNREERALIYECQKLCIFATTWIKFFAQVCAISYLINPFVENIGRNVTERSLPFPLWVNLPVSVSPYYEVIYFLEILSMCHIIICYICFDNILCLLNFHVSTQFRILQRRLTFLGNMKETDTLGTLPPNFPSKCYDSLKSCVRQHQQHVKYTEQVDSVFTGIILANVVSLSVVLCLVGYQIFLAESSVARRVVFICNFFISTTQLLLVAYSCNGLIEESSNISTAVYSGPWINLPMNKDGRQVRNDLKMVIIRSNKPCCLTAGGFFPVSLQMSTKIFSTALSYMTLLRQSIS